MDESFDTTESQASLGLTLHRLDYPAGVVRATPQSALTTDPRIEGGTEDRVCWNPSMVEIDKLQLERIPTDRIELYPDNPRFLHLQLKGRSNLSQDEMIHVLEDEDATITLHKAIKNQGVLNPLVVQPKGDRFVVIDGNRRTVVLKLLLKEKTRPPPGVTYDLVPARILPAEMKLVDIEVLMGVLQEGQKPWGRFNDAAYVRRLRTVYHLELDDIAEKLQSSVKKVKEKIDDYALFERYVGLTNDTDPDRFSYFADAPKDVRGWFGETQKNFETYCNLICPLSPDHKIRSVTTKGGLRDFSRVLKDEEALEALLSDSGVTVEEALAIAVDNDLTLAAPFLKRLGSLAEKMRSLDSTQIEMLKQEPKLKIQVQKLREACDDLAKRLG